MSSRPVQSSVLLVALMVLGCQDGDEGTGTDGQTGTATSDASTGGTGGTGGTDTGATDTGATTPTGGVLTSTDGEASSETGAPTTDTPTTGEPVVCDSPEGCTGAGGGDLASFTLPFFRGKVCVSDAPQPGDPVAISMTTCVHPCLSISAFKYKYLYRCTGGGCELAIVGYHPDTVGTNCPDDVFGEFPAAACEFSGPYAITTSPLLLGPDPFAGAGSLLVPFMTNADVEAIAGGDSESASIWARIEGHAQAVERSFAMDFAADNAAAPVTCSEGTPGCTCRDIGL